MQHFAILYIQGGYDIFFDPRPNYRAALFDVNGKLIFDTETDIGSIWSWGLNPFYPSIELSANNLLTVMLGSVEWHEPYYVDLNIR